MANLSASDFFMGRFQNRVQVVSSSSHRNVACQIYCSSGLGESTQDVVKDGLAMIAENGLVLCETERFARAGTYILHDIDLSLISFNRRRNNAFQICASRTLSKRPPFRTVVFEGRLGIDDPSQYFRLIRHSPKVPLLSCFKQLNALELLCTRRSCSN